MISVTGGLGSWQQDEDGSARYCTTADTLGAHARTACLFLPAPRRGWRLGALSGRARRLPQGLAALPAARRPGQAGGLLCAGPVRGRPVRPRGHHHNISGGLRACVQRACAPTTSREPVARAAAPELRTGPKRKHSLRRAVKVVTFLTLPLELESESPALQVCCSDARLLTLSLFSASQAWLCHSTRRLSGSCTRAARTKGCCPRRGRRAPASRARAAAVGGVHGGREGGVPGARRAGGGCGAGGGAAAAPRGGPRGRGGRQHGAAGAHVPAQPGRPARRRAHCRCPNPTPILSAGCSAVAAPAAQPPRGPAAWASA